MQEGRITEMVGMESTEMLIKELTQKSRAFTTQRVKIAILWQTKTLKTGRKVQKSL